MNIWILCSHTYREKDRFGYDTAAVLFLFFQLLQRGSKHWSSFFTF